VLEEPEPSRRPHQPAPPPTVLETVEEEVLVG
jgi:hypothetical protein